VITTHPASAPRARSETRPAKPPSPTPSDGAYNAETTLARALDGHYARAGDEAYALIREALTTSGDIIPDSGQLLIRLDPLTAPRRTQALAALCDQLNQAHACYPGTELTCATRSNPTPALHEIPLYVRSPDAHSPGFRAYEEIGDEQDNRLGLAPWLNPRTP
jgi:hypothetical protein